MSCILAVLFYDELSAKNIWLFDREVPKFMWYFPDYLHGFIPDRTYLLIIFWKLRKNKMQTLTQQTYKCDALANEDDYKKKPR